LVKATYLLGVCPYGQRMRRAVLVTISVVIVVALVLAAWFAVGLGPLQPGAGPAPPVRYSTEPFPAVWQGNYTGTPASAVLDNGTLFVLTYGSGALGPPPFGPDYPWNLLAVSATNGSLLWSHELLASESGNLAPEIVVLGGVVYFVEAADSLAVDSTPLATGPAIFAVGFNVSSGAEDSFDLTPVPTGFAVTGYFAILGTTAYLGWPSGTGGSAAVTVEAVDLLNPTRSALLWSTSVTTAAAESNIPRILVDAQYLVLPFGALWVLDSQTGKILFSTNFSALGGPGNAVNGALVGATYYSVAEWTAGRGLAFDYCLTGLDLANQRVAENVTVETGPYISGPEAVNALSGLLVISSPSPLGPGTAPTGAFLVLSPQGTVLWSSALETVPPVAGSNPVPIGSPLAPLSNGTWLLSSLGEPSGSGPAVTQYFEGVESTTGGILWTHAFTFASPSGSSQLYPPNELGPSSVVVLTTAGNELVYRWNLAIGLAIV
jgi:hypothetical protein